MKIKKRVLNDALRVLGKVVCQTSPVELYRSIRFVGDECGGNGWGGGGGSGCGSCDQSGGGLLSALQRAEGVDQNQSQR